MAGKGGQGPMVSNTPAGYEVRARRRLGEAGAFEALIDELGKKLQSKDGQVGCNIADCDLSQNKLTQEQWEAVFTTLAQQGARVQRFRLFGCATLNDEVVRVFSEYMRELTQESAPHELHLSDCAITTDGFNLLMSVIEDTDLYPQPAATSGKFVPLYLRLENNYISEAAIQEKVDAGVVRTFMKNTGARPASEGTVKVNLLIQKVGQYQQKQGEPPAPEDAPPPKEVWDKFTQSSQQQWQWNARPQGQWGQQQWGANSWGNAHTQRAGSWGAAPAALPQPGAANGGYRAAAGAAAFRPPIIAPIRPGGSAALIRPLPRAAGAATPRNNPTANAGKPAWNASKPAYNAFATGGASQSGGGAGAAANGGKGAGKASGGWHQDRSRTPAGRTGGGGGKPMQPTAPPPATNTDLPYPWEEHFSDEYGIPYFWNAETGEALWEKPTA